MITLAYHGKSSRAVHYVRGYFIANWHLLSLKADGRESVPTFGKEMRIQWQTFEKVIILEERITYRIPNQDLVVLYLPEIAPLPPLKPRIPPTSQCSDTLMADSAFMVTIDGEKPVQTLQRVRVKGWSGLANTWKYTSTTVGGDCMSIVCGVFGNNFTIVGGHFCVDNIGNAYAESISQDVIEAVIPVLDQTAPIPPLTMVYQTEDLHPFPFEFQPLSRKSSLAANLGGDFPMPVAVAGTIPNFRTTTFKSRVVPMPRRQLWDALELKYCGSNNYFRAPTGKGAMEGEHWVDPFVVNMNAAEDKGGCHAVWELAMLDYLDGIMTLHGRDRVRPLTDYEAMFGVAATDIGGIDMSTSTGPPYNCPKNRHFRINHEFKFVEYSGEMERMFEKIDVAIAAGMSISGVCNYVLKDEAISNAKLEAHKVRVFNVLSACLNIRLKQYFGPIMIFMRTHPFFFETAVGMNVTSFQWGVLHDWLDAYPNWMAADNSFFDVKMSTREGLWTAAALISIAKACQYTAAEIHTINSLLHSCIFTTRICKGDVFYSTFMMCTGFWLTLIFNTIRNCLQRRYCFIRLRPHADLMFRDGVRQFTLGDDNVATTKWLWYNQQSIQEACKEFGAVITDSHKRQVISRFDVKESVTFLKRNFRPFQGLMLAPIEVKTLVKMVTVRVSGALSHVDHVCTLYSNVLAEVWMHGEELFNEFNDLIEKIVNEEGYVSAYLVRLSYEEYLLRYRDGALCLWDPLENRASAQTINFT